MKTSNNILLGKTVYSLIFLAVLPAGLFFWAKNAGHAVSLPAVHSTVWGLALTSVSVLLMLAGMHALWQFGKGLPMNAYPPPQFVRESVFRLLPHPIYTGFVLGCFGISMYSGNAAGFWLVSPVALAGCAALVWGYERLDLLRRFPEAPRQYMLAIPPNTEAAPMLKHRVSVYLCLLLPWMLLNAAAFYVLSEKNLPEPFFHLTATGLSDSLKWLTGTIALAWVAAAPLVAHTQRQLRRFFLGGLVGGAAVIYLAFLMPTIGLGHRSVLQSPLWVNIAFSISWFWFWLAASLFDQVMPAYRSVFIGVATLLTFGVVATSVDPIAHAFSGAAGFVLGMFYPAIWEYLREIAEAVANSWKEWVFGPMRVINHGFYVGIGAFAGTLMGGLLAGETYVFAIVVFGVIVTVCAGLWGQFIEGSDKLKRPFGFYGAMVGIVFASLVMRWMGVNVWVTLGVFSVFMPWVQGIGRLRCLVNGCCHGSESKEWLGIRYVHPRSRVCFISGMKGKPLHPTPLYSMLWLALVGGLQIHLWLMGAELSLIFGTYLILNGLGRFVEEAYRGEPQTPVWGKLRLYQWAAIVSILAGIIVSFFEAPMPSLSPGITGQTLAWGAFIWVFVQFLMGIDFPRSQRRFSRLA